MSKISDWLTEKFQHPLTPLFFIFGTLLILLGISTGVNIPNLSQVTSDPNFRVTSLILGTIFCLLSIVLYYRPPKNTFATNRNIPLPQELTLNFNGRRATLTESQGSLLNYMVRVGMGGNYITLKSIKTRFKTIPETELIYRLEYLRLLCFLERQDFGQKVSNNTSYKLSDSYQKELGDEKVIRTARMTSSKAKKQ